MISLGARPRPSDLAEEAVTGDGETVAGRRGIDSAFDEARAVLLARFETVAIADIAADFDRAFARLRLDRPGASSGRRR